MSNSLFAKDMRVYISNPKMLLRNSATHKYLQYVAGYKINSKKSVALLYTDDKWAEKEIRETSPFTIASNNKISLSNCNQEL